MGAALLRDPEKLASILRRLVTGLPFHSITAKIRVLPDRQETLRLVKRISETGIKALTVHCRTPSERPRHPAHHELLPEIISICPFPVIANGDIFSLEDMLRIKLTSGASSLMIARGAQWNASIFRREGLLDEMDVAREYLKRCLALDNPFNNSKYTVLQMWLDRPLGRKDLVAQIQQCKGYPELCLVFSLDHHGLLSLDGSRERELHDVQDEDWVEPA